MELLVQILMLFVVLATALRLSFSSRGYALVYALLLGGFVYLSSPYAIEQTKTGLAAYIADRSLREYAAIFISLEVALFVGYSFSRLERPSSRRRQLLALALAAYPGLLLFPVLFYLQSTLLFALPGVSFSLLAFLLAVASALAVYGLGHALRWLVPEEELRLEVFFLVQLFTFILGIIASVDETVRTAPSSPIAWRGLALSAGIAVLCFGLGYLIPRIKQSLRHKA
ncbi:hypothetical protein [Porphyromonas sp. oral taxon 275]|uniref:hypothetical protein n=1 Tax=Porphyromonas sp. oral taxon 275 TaxID=712435 RepID=UPI001BAA9897|nr:hypothetical protein [Porphyromonas sp. oral taxon 275]QUB42479.1 hypothetical protein J4862_05590 [Porphyromonas sp. oral taxon 275]